MAARIPPLDQDTAALHLPVLNPNHTTLPQRPRKMLKWRLTILIAVHILIIAHIVQWKMMGTTIAPLVAAESMYTLEQGQLNNGFLIFAAVLLVTLFVGRFLCGWACHMGGLQLFTAWLLKKVGIRPRLFRARLLGYIPLVLGLYMFVWPSFVRWLLVPALDHVWPWAANYLRPAHAFPGWSVKLMTHDMWENLPSVAVTIPFLLVCGTATVYFLGARGFCRYACPYGGIMSRLQQLAPGRVVADLNKCDKCGICTAACVSGVQVLDEIQTFGRVVDRRCTRSLDCIDVCPTKALSFGLTKPAIIRNGKSLPHADELYDLHWGEEIMLLVAFAFSFFIVRGLYGLVPMLMAAAIAGCSAFIVWKMWRVLRDRNCRFGPLQLKIGGKFKPAGAAYLAFAAAFLMLALHSAAIQVLNQIGGAVEARVTIDRDSVFSGDPARVPTEQKAIATDALRWYGLARSWRFGGIGLADTPAVQVRTAWLHLVAGHADAAQAALEQVLAQDGPKDALAADLSQIQLLRGHEDDARQQLEIVFAKHEDFAQVRDQLAWLYARAGRWDKANGVYQRVLESDPSDPWVNASYAHMLMQQGQTSQAQARLETAAAAKPKHAGIRHELAVARFYSGDVDGALTDLTEAAKLDPTAKTELLRQGAEMLNSAGRGAEVERWKVAVDGK